MGSVRAIYVIIVFHDKPGTRRRVWCGQDTNHNASLKSYEFVQLNQQLILQCNVLIWRNTQPRRNYYDYITLIYSQSTTQLLQNDSHAAHDLITKWTDPVTSSAIIVNNIFTFVGEVIVRLLFETTLVSTSSSIS